MGVGVEAELRHALPDGHGVPLKPRSSCSLNHSISTPFRRSTEIKEKKVSATDETQIGHRIAAFKPDAVLCEQTASIGGFSESAAIQGRLRER